jgi:hypothetical protein
MKQYNNREKATTYSNDATVRNADPHPSKSMLSAYQGSIIAIMQGNAGRTITELYDLGGGSGAAVPRTLVCPYSFLVDFMLLHHHKPRLIIFRTPLIFNFVSSFMT